MSKRAVDHAGGHTEVSLPTPETAKLGLERLLQRQTLSSAQPRTVADLEVPNPITRRILDHLVGHPLDRFGRLEQRNRVLEALEIILETRRMLHHHESPKRLGVRGRQRESGLSGQLDHGFRPEASCRDGCAARPSAGAGSIQASASTVPPPLRERITTLRIDPAARLCATSISIPRASVTNAVPAVTRSSSAGSCARSAARTSVPGSTSIGAAVDEYTQDRSHFRVDTNPAVPPISTGCGSFLRNAASASTAIMAARCSGRPRKTS